MTARLHDRVVVGGGLVGLSTALELLRRRPGLSLALVEKEGALAAHQSGRNSGVIHSGFVYRPGSLKARLCVEGRARLLAFCEERGVPVEMTGKLVVATRESELPALDDLLARARANGVEGVVRVGPEGIREREPHAAGLGALFVPGAGIVDFGRVAGALGEAVREAGGEILLGTEVTGLVERAGEVVVGTSQGDLRARAVVACAGLQSDRVAALSRRSGDLRIVPFRGGFRRLRAEARPLVRGLVYPVPDPRFPFAGVHLTRRVDGEVIAGPTAVLALAREGYRRRDVRLRDVADVITWPGWWRLAARHLRAGLADAWLDASDAACLRAVQRLVPAVRAKDLLPGPAGIRAQAVARDGSFVDDFSMAVAGRVLHVRNAPSPAATSCLAIAGEIAGRLDAALGNG